MTKRQRLRLGLVYTSFFIFPATYYYFSPVLPVEAATDGTVNGSLVMFCLLFLSALIFGRGFCGWLCPGAGCLDALIAVRSRKIGGGRLLKWLVWLPWIATVIFLAYSSGGYKEVDFFYRTTYGFSIGTVLELLIYLFVLGLIVVPALLFGKRAFCHYLCWMAPFMLIGRYLRNRLGYSSLQLQTTSEECSECGVCSKLCPMSLPVQQSVVMQNVEHPDCILCGNCIDNCLKNVLKYQWGKR